MCVVMGVMMMVGAVRFLGRAFGLFGALTVARVAAALGGRIFGGVVHGWFSRSRRRARRVITGFFEVPHAAPPVAPAPETARHVPRAISRWIAGACARKRRIA